MIICFGYFYSNTTACISIRIIRTVIIIIIIVIATANISV